MIKDKRKKIKVERIERVEGLKELKEKNSDYTSVMGLGFKNAMKY